MRSACLEACACQGTPRSVRVGACDSKRLAGSGACPTCYAIWIESYTLCFNKIHELIDDLKSMTPTMGR